jgi:hypothetical protein
MENNYLRVSLDIVVSKDDVVGGTRGGRDDIERVLGLEAPQVDAAIISIESPNPNIKTEQGDREKRITWCRGRRP